MRKILLSAAALSLVGSLHAASQFRDFVSVQGDQLVEEGKPFRFISWDIPNLHLVEDYIPFEPGEPASPRPARAQPRRRVGVAVARPF